RPLPRPDRRAGRAGVRPSPDPGRGGNRTVPRHGGHGDPGPRGRDGAQDRERGMTDFDYDLFVIGGGSGGVRAARIAAQHGARVGIAEEYRYGGTCVIRGCVPKKLLVYASKFSDEFEDAAGFGWTVGERSVDWQTLIHAKDRAVARLEGLCRRKPERAGVKRHDTRAVIEGPHTVRMLSTDRRVTAKVILIATGATPNVDPTLRGGEHVITSNEAFHLTDFPSRIVVAGGGYIAVEF